MNPILRHSGRFSEAFILIAIALFCLAAQTVPRANGATASKLTPADLKKLKVLYIGDPGSARSKEVTDFLKTKVAQIEAAPRNGFKPSQAANFDVAVLDWQQNGDSRDAWSKPAPLGDRESWTKPTVLLGSAGLNMAVVWKVRGGSG